MDSNFDFDALLKFLGVAVAAVVALIRERYRAKPNLVAYISHAAAFDFPTATSSAPDAQIANPPGDGRSATAPAVAPATSPPTAVTQSVYTHSIAIRNVGKLSAKNVRIGHNLKPGNYSMDPRVFHRAGDVPKGGWEIWLPVMVPDEFVQVAYMYVPPMTWSQINSYVKSDESSATVLPLNAMPASARPAWRRWTYAALAFVGIAYVTYWLLFAMVWIYHVAPQLTQVLPTS